MRTLALMGWGLLPFAVFPNMTGQTFYPQATRQNYSVPQQMRWKQTDDRNRAISQIANRRSIPIKPYVNPLDKVRRPSSGGGGDGSGFSDRAWEQIRYFGSGVNPPSRVKEPPANPKPWLDPSINPPNRWLNQ